MGTVPWALRITPMPPPHIHTALPCPALAVQSQAMEETSQM